MKKMQFPTSKKPCITVHFGMRIMPQFTIFVLKYGKHVLCICKSFYLKFQVLMLFHQQY